MTAFVGLVLFATLAAPGCNGCARSTSAPTSTSTSTAFVRITLDGISVDTWRAAGAGSHPAILLLHGAAGPELFTDPTSDHRRYPEIFAAGGYSVFMPHYENGRGDRLAVVTRMLDAVVADPGVDPKRVAIVGYSRGANLTLRLAVADARPAAVVDYYGWLSGADAEKMTRMPPTLILHGAKDGDVRVDEAYKLEGLFRAKKVDYEIHVYPDEEHGFSKRSLGDSATRTLAFLGARLGVDASPRP